MRGKFFKKISPKNESAGMDQLDKPTDVIDANRRSQRYFLFAQKFQITTIDVDLKEEKTMLEHKMSLQREENYFGQNMDLFTMNWRR